MTRTRKTQPYEALTSCGDGNEVTKLIVMIKFMVVFTDLIQRWASLVSLALTGFSQIADINTFINPLTKDFF